ncbi:UDP-glucosyltransferase 2-like isoform X1 [Homalodisca vitripennis]|uniref:UDP-glucosyltransferase 2-like isoform X1 n=1 Tax=Homalodisca vitripennis TaxID=197043 RepID=UPI001EE9FBC3|nr:UDP-glucosyltransferase 2-like isoform X1 [Homalodisca vitripennis]XP_046660642.1 UDP-glucosyltransferase 2-like isoform X1 [Homalodisca vitripennis]
MQGCRSWPFLSSATRKLTWVFYQHLGVGVKLDFATISEDTVYKAVTTVLNDRRYKDNAEMISRIVRDQPMSPIDSAVYWIEYVLRHRDTQHLRPASAVQPWYQLWLLDVVAAVLVFICLTFLILYKIIKWFVNSLRGRPIPKVHNE